MIFYHVSCDLSHDGNFYPRIPLNISTKVNENESIKRVCVGKSLEDCFTGIPSGGYSFDKLVNQQNLFKVFKIDIEKLNISDDYIVTDEILFEKDLVRDALHTNENWILKDFLVPIEDTFIIKVLNWNEESEDVVPFDIWKEAMNGDGDYEYIYRKTYNDLLPCMVVITDLEYEIIGIEDLYK